MGDAGCLSIFGRNPKQHELLADHLTSEYKTKVMAKGHTVDEWKLRAGSPDNHWLDCLVGCAAAASILGATLNGMGGTFAKPKRKKLKLSEIQKRKRGWT
jgi:UDP-N-acetylmuramyl pentapeptide synthase